MRTTIVETASNTMNFRYRAPVIYAICAALFISIGAVGAFFFAFVEPWVFRGAVLFLMTVALVGGAGFFVVFIRSIFRRLVLSPDKIRLPFRTNRRPVELNYTDISLSEENHRYGRILNLVTAEGNRYRLDENWIEKGCFDKIAAILRERTDARIAFPAE